MTGPYLCRDLLAAAITDAYDEFYEWLNEYCNEEKITPNELRIFKETFPKIIEAHRETVAIIIQNVSQSYEKDLTYMKDELDIAETKYEL